MSTTILEANNTILKGFGIPSEPRDGVHLMGFTITCTGTDYPIITATYMDTNVIIDEEFEELLETFVLTPKV